ncbi:UDP-glycosyltransferase 74G1 [Sesamum angolense]|uniref:Glycosyltransferase n=1 Tax=Sesamum angolense TaxID=2727404 RepID=A0AAE1X3G5_9LAMI|nr:UDP-glycosyltransferase 74G1 [Sesamum angolense]
MDTKKANANETAHCLILPYPIQGHINPMLQFAKRLSHKRLKITLALTRFILKTIKGLSGGSISIGSISDGFDEGGRAQAKTHEEYLARFQQVGRETLMELLQALADSGSPVDCVVYDPFIPWVLDLAKGSGLLAAAFFTQSCAVDCIYHRVYCGELKVPVRGSEKVVVPGLPPLRPEDMPSFIYVHGSYPSAFEMVTGQFQNIDKADWIFVNTFYKLEEEVINCMSRTWKVKAIGPTIPSMYLDKRLHDDKEYGLNIFKTTTDVCTNWLSKKQPKSVIYISFGSLAQLSVEQIEELAHALTTLNKHFLWVVRSSELAKLPKNFSEESSEKGLIVSWCQQLEILAHDAVGCFVTHCGWNSTLEGLSLGVPIVAMPQWTDQSTNTKFVVDVWRVGIWARADEKGLVREGEIRRCIKHVMEGDGEEIRENASKWKEMARDAVDEGGSSDRNIQEFVSTLMSSLKGVN